MKGGPERAPAPGGERLALAALYAAAVWAFAVGRSAPGAWPFLAAAAAVPFFRPRTLPPTLDRALVAVARIEVALVILFAAVNSLYPVISDRTIAVFALVAGYSLLALGAVLPAVAGRAASGRLSVAIALVAVASLDPAAPIGPPVAAACLAGLAYLLAGPTQGATDLVRRGRTTRLTGALVLGGAAGALALGILRLLPWAQPRVEEATARLFNPAYAVSSAGFSEISSLGDIEQLALSPTVVLRVWTRSPRRLRARVLTQFTGRGWRALPGSRRALAPAAAGSPLEPALREWLAAIPGRTFVDAAVAEPAPRVETRIAPLRLPPGVLFSPAAPWLVRIEADGLRVASSVLDPPAEAPGLYGIVHGVGDGVEGEAGGSEPSAALLALPADTDPRLRELARVLGEGDPSAAARVARTAGYLGAHCRYSLAPGAFRGPQPVAEFVFEKKKGYCEYFASAAAVLLRLQGVPARYVAGFNVTDDDLVGGHYVVREANAHAWIDAYLPGRGWVEVDPTPAAEYAALRGPMRRSGLAAAWDALGARAAGLWIALRFGAGRTETALFAAAVLAAGLALRFGRRWLRRARARPRARPAEPAASVPPEIAGLLARADRLWARRGFPRPPHRAPLEHVQSLPPDRIEAEALSACRDAVECYYRARFGGVVPERDEVAGLARRLS